MTNDNVTLYPKCYTYYLISWIQEFRAMRDDENISCAKLREQIINVIAPATDTATKKKFIKRLHEECYTKLALCQAVENSCSAGKKTPMRHYA